MTATVAATRRVPAVAIAAGLALLWLIVAPRTPDLAAAVYRAGLFAREGFQLYDSAWFGGHHMPGYSIVAPILGAEVGVRVTGALAAVAAVLVFEQLAVGRWGAAAARPAVTWFAVASVTDLLIGRITFGMGVAVGLGALLALQRSRPLLAAGFAVGCAATSPVAALFLALAATAVRLADRRAHGATVVAGAAVGSVAVLSVAFPEGGVQPFSVGALIAILLSSAVIAAVAGPRERAIRVGAGLYAAAGLVAFAVPTPMGGNLSRLGAEFAAPLLLGLLFARPPSARIAQAFAVAALAFFAVWQWTAPVRETSRGVGDPSYEAAYYAGLLAFIAADAGSRPVRVEVPFTRSHWEAVHVAPRFPLARGWETQLDTKYNDIFRRGELTATKYRRWLVRNAVSYVALPDVPLDPSGRAEAGLIRGGLRFLEPAWRDSHWRLYRVRDARPLVSGPAELVRLDAHRFVLSARGSGSALVRVRWTPYWVVEEGGCVARAGAWTRVALSGAGRVAVRARFSPRRLVARQRNCSQSGRA